MCCCIALQQSRPRPVQGSRPQPARTEVALAAPQRTPGWARCMDDALRRRKTRRVVLRRTPPGSPAQCRWYGSTGRSGAKARRGGADVDRMLVGQARLVAVLGAQVVRGALGDVQLFGDRAQVGDVVQTDLTHKAPFCEGAHRGRWIRWKRHFLTLRFAPEIIGLILGHNRN